MFDQRTNKVNLAVFSAIIAYTNVHTLVCHFENGFSYRFEPQLVQNISSGAISDPHFTQESELVSFFFLGFLVFVVIFLAAFFVPQLVQNISSGLSSEPHFTQEDCLVSFFFLGFLVFVVVFLAAFLGLGVFFFAISPTSPSSVMTKPSAPSFIPDLLRYCLSYSSSSCWRDFLPVAACTCLGFGVEDGSGSGADGVGGELDPAFFAPQLVQNASSAPICEPQLEQEPDPACVSPGLGRRGSGLKSLPR